MAVKKPAAKSPMTKAEREKLQARKKKFLEDLEKFAGIKNLNDLAQRVLEEYYATGLATGMRPDPAYYGKKLTEKMSARPVPKPVVIVNSNK